MRGLERGVWQLDRKEKGRRSGVLIMGQLIGLVRPLIHIMILAVVLGVSVRHISYYPGRTGHFERTICQYDAL